MEKLKERAATDEAFAAALARESGEDAAKIRFGLAGSKNNAEACKNPKVTSESHGKANK